MWDDRRKVGVLNDFDLARFAGQGGASGQDNTGTLPFMALDLLSEKGLGGEIPRRYRHEAESFTWCLICLYFATVEDEGGENRTRHPHPLSEWFQGWQRSYNAKFALRWHGNSISGVRLAHPNTRDLAYTLHEYWVNRYKKQFARPLEEVKVDPSFLGTSDIEDSEEETEDLPYEEPEDHHVFRRLLVKHVKRLHAEPLRDIGDVLFRMTSKYKEIDWRA